MTITISSISTCNQHFQLEIPNTKRQGSAVEAEKLINLNNADRIAHYATLLELVLTRRYILQGEDTSPLVDLDNQEHKGILFCPVYFSETHSLHSSGAL